ncbi:HK97-gp10 family putative phage morphogenesis protein [Xanthobacter autotrophicus]|uniref:HK97-gp10 family putative phage morphogenesis protein n=1 Tax=Xanthobacter autotrophicus TaxID=280 RepID=UPI003729D67B
MAILGLPSLRRKLRAMPDMAKAEIMLAMEAAAEDIVRMAKNLVPVDKGDLLLSISWTWGDPPKGVKLVAKSKKVKGLGDLRITVFAGNDEAFYARWVEFGTKATPARASRRNRNYRRTLVMTKEYKAHAATPAQPFFFPAYRANKKRVKSRVSRAITKAAKKVAAGK